jgi:hypothetical protein
MPFCSLPCQATWLHYALTVGGMMVDQMRRPPRPASTEG